MPPNAPTLFAEVSNQQAVASDLSVDNTSTYFQMFGAITAAQVVFPQTSEGLSYKVNAGGGSVSVYLTGYSMPNGDV